MRYNGKKTAFLGMNAALALILTYLESLIPPLYAAVPGIKLGLPNIVIIFILYRVGFKEAAIVSAVRIVAVWLLFGNAMMLAYSAAGALLSLTVMVILKKVDILSTVGVSVAGGVLHNVGQILMAILLLGTAEIGYYLIVLAITGTISGVFIGICGSIALKRIQIKNFL